MAKSDIITFARLIAETDEPVACNIAIRGECIAENDENLGSAIEVIA